MGFRSTLRRALLGIGAALLVSGWGLTLYADAQLAAVASGKAESISFWEGDRVKASAWVGRQEFVPGKTLYQTGILCMGIGAAVGVLALPRGS